MTGDHDWLVVNPAAGGATEPTEIVRTVREATGRPPTIRVTSKGGDARHFAKEAAESGVARLWVAGGDGTLHEVVLGLRDAGVDDPPVLVPLPLGTGNDLVRSLGFPLDWSTAVKALAGSSRTVELDLMAVHLDGEERLGLNAVVIGNGGRVGRVLDREGKSWWGPLAYLRSATEVALELEPAEMTLQVDDGPERSARLLNVVVANGRFAAHGIPIAPGARPDDRRLELVMIEEASLPELLRMVPALLDGVEPTREEWVQRSITSLRLTSSGSVPLPVSVDGETLEASRVRVTLAEDRVRIRIPEDLEGASDDD